MIPLKQSGQGLIETAVTFVIIASVLIALVRFQINLSYSNSVSQQQNTALILASSQLETLRDYSTLIGSNSYDNIISGSSTYLGQSAQYTTTWTVTPSASPKYKTLNVTVSWTDRDGIAQSIQLSNLVSGIEPTYSSIIME